VYYIPIKFLKYSLTFLVGIGFVGISAFAQNTLPSKNDLLIDSLKQVLNKAEGIDRFDLLYDLTFEHIAKNDLESSLLYADEALKISLNFGDSLKIVKSTRVKGQILRRLDRTNDAIKEFQRILPIAKRNKFTNEIKFILNSLAVAYTLQAEYDEALNYHFQSLLIRQAEGNSAEISAAFNNIGLVYFKLKNYHKALEYYEQALKLENTVNNSNFKDRLLINIGLCYNQLSDFVSSRKYINEGLTLCEPNCQSPTLIEGEFGLGVSYYGENSFQNAKSHFQKSFSISSSSGDKRFQAENLVYLGRIDIREGKADSATLVLIKAEKIALESGYNELLIETYREFSNLFAQLKNFERASYYQNLYIHLKDSIYSESLIDNLAKIQTNYAERENIKTIAANEEVIKRQVRLNIAIAIIAILATLLIFVLYRSNRVKKKVNAALSEAKTIIEDQNKQLLNSNIHLNEELKEKNIDLEKANESLRRVNDELDNFIYKTSHDIRGPLASLKGMCNVALMDVHDPVALDYLHKLDITADKLNSILTRLLIVNQINNSTIGHELIDFNGIVTDVLLLEKKKGLPPKFVIRKKIGSDIEFYSDKEFVRIILENLIDNAIKFYNDSQRVEPFVDINISLAKDHVLIRVVDNGIGISEVQPDKIFQMFSRASERSETGGIGLYITKTAVQKLGGLIDLRTNPEGNTEFFIKLPVVMSKVIA
jgi:signal transduction histidine kinase